jgi:hypothetical protein
LLHAVRASAQVPSLPFWNDGSAKQAINTLVKEVTDKASPKYVDPEDRIATFDQDVTLWVEHPLYTQAVFALDRVHELALQHPEWNHLEPFRAVLANDPSAMARFSESDWETIVAATHAGMSPDAFREIVKQWLANTPGFIGLTRPCVSADARGPGISARQQVQDLHRYGGWPGVRPCIQ